MPSPFGAYSLDPDEAIALTALRGNEEGESFSDAAGAWHSVYLDNAKPHGWEPTFWRGILANLARKGLYRSDDGYAWGLVLVG